MSVPEMGRTWGRSRVWEHRFFDRVIRSVEKRLAAVKCVEQNPVKAGLCSLPEENSSSIAQLSAPADMDRFMAASEGAYS